MTLPITRKQIHPTINWVVLLLNEDKFLKLESAIEELKDEHKKCLIHFYLKKKSYDEVATITGFDLNQVKSFIQNGKRNLKLILEKHSEFRS